MTSSFGPLVDGELARAMDRAGGGKGRPSWGGLVSRWRSFVNDVGRGYRDSIYDYTNDLSTRDRLARVLVELSDETRALVEPELVEIDALLVASTGPSSVALPGSGGAGASWWWWRIPLRLSDELRGDLEAERVISGPGP